MDNLMDTDCKVTLWLDDARIARHQISLLSLMGLVDALPTTGGLAFTKLTVEANGIVREFCQNG